MLDAPRSLGGLRVIELVLFVVGIELSFLCSDLSPWTQHCPADTFTRSSVPREFDCGITSFDSLLRQGAVGTVGLTILMVSACVCYNGFVLPSTFL